MKYIIIILAIHCISYELNDNVETGVVEYFLEDKGYGYIVSNSKYYYVHKDFLIDEIKKGDCVSFTVKVSKRGYQAHNVRLLKS